MTAPERICASLATVHQCQGKWECVPFEIAPDSPQYILATPEALAASPEVAALIAEARREGWNAAIEAANWLGLTFYDKVPKGSLTSVTILEYREAIRALKETTHD